MFCLHCGGPARWVFTNSGVADQAFCERHVPDVYRGKQGLSPAPIETPESEPEEPAAKPTPKPRPRKRSGGSSE